MKKNNFTVCQFKCQLKGKKSSRFSTISRQLAFFFVSGILWSHLSWAASLVSPAVKYSFVTKDLKPIEGVELMGYLQYDILSSMDCTGFICIPSLPHWKAHSEAAVPVGTSSASGTLVIPPMTWSSEELVAKNPRLHFFTNGLLMDLCKGSKKAYYADHLNLFAPSSDGTSLEINSRCLPKTVGEEADETEMYCISTYTLSELESKKAQIIEDCE